MIRLPLTHVNTAIGEAGTGKTHLLCDIAQNRVKTRVANRFIVRTTI